MIFHRAESRGQANHGWLHSYHTFSFADYYDPSRMGFGALRVINDDSVAPGMGFGRHPHRDMEIISLPLAGVLEHKDSEGNSSRISQGEVQIMSAGTGILHSEYNASAEEEVKFLQIWVLPKELRIRPRYQQKRYQLTDNKFTLIVSPDEDQGSVAINQDAYFSLAKVTASSTIPYRNFISSHGVYVFILKGEVLIQQQRLKARDGLGLLEGEEFKLEGLSDAEVLVMEVPL